MVSGQGLYAYGLVSHCPVSLDVSGIDRQQRVYPIEGQGLCAIVSTIDVEAFQEQVKSVFSDLLQYGASAAQGTEDLLQVHERVVETLMKDAPVVPFKFGTILRDEAAVIKLLQEDGPRFTQLLAKFAGREEWGVKVYADIQKFAAYVRQSNERARRLDAQRNTLAKGTAYFLGRKIEEEIKSLTSTQLAAIAEHVFQTLGELSSEVKISKALPQKMTQKKQEMVLNGAYLLAKERVDAFCERGKCLVEEYATLGLELEFSGPWPPYSFV